MDLDGVRWRKSSWSSGQDEENSNCVEAAMIGSASSALSSDAANAIFAAIRDSKNPDSALLLPRTAWSGLVCGLSG